MQFARGIFTPKGDVGPHSWSCEATFLIIKYRQLIYKIISLKTLIVLKELICKKNG